VARTKLLKVFDKGEYVGKTCEPYALDFSYIHCISVWSFITTPSILVEIWFGQNFRNIFDKGE